MDMGVHLHPHRTASEKRFGNEAIIGAGMENVNANELNKNASVSRYHGVPAQDLRLCLRSAPELELELVRVRGALRFHPLQPLHHHPLRRHSIAIQFRLLLLLFPCVNWSERGNAKRMNMISSIYEGA